MNTGDPNIVPTVTLGTEPLEAPAVAQPAQPEPAPAPAAEPAPAEPTADKLILGKFKDADSLARAYTELESSHTRKAEEAAALRRQGELYEKALEMAQRQSQEPKQPGRDFNAELNLVQQRLESGEISTAEALNLTSQITEERTLSRARQEYQNFDSERQTKTAEQQFLKNNPDFNEVLRSGALDQILQDNPLYTNLNAYQEYKAQQQIAALQAEKEAAAREAFEKGKSEVQKLAEGSKVAETVISKPGTEMRTEKPTKTLDEREIKAGMLNRLNQLRGG